MCKPKIIQLFDVKGYDLVYIDLRNICTVTVSSGFGMNVLTINGKEYKVSDEDLKAFINCFTNQNSYLFEDEKHAE